MINFQWSPPWQKYFKPIFLISLANKPWSTSLLCANTEGYPILVRNPMNTKWLINLRITWIKSQGTAVAVLYTLSLVSTEVQVKLVSARMGGLLECYWHSSYGWRRRPRNLATLGGLRTRTLELASRTLHILSFICPISWMGLWHLCPKKGKRLYFANFT